MSYANFINASLFCVVKYINYVKGLERGKSNNTAREEKADSVGHPAGEQEYVDETKDILKSILMTDEHQKESEDEDQEV